MDLDDVRIFTKVVEAGSFTHAANQLGIPKSTVSRRVGALEDALGVRLLQRTTRKLTLTDAGRLYFGRTSRIMEELQQAHVALEQLQSEPRGLLRITTPSDMSGLVSHLTGAFQKRFPHVEVVVFATGRRVDLVAEGYDLALRAGRQAHSSMVSRRLMDSSFRIFASPGYLKERGTPRTPEALADHMCLCFGTEHAAATWRLTGPAGSRDVHVSGPLASNDFALLTVAAVEGRGLALLPELSAAGEVDRGLLEHVLTDYAFDSGGLYAVYPSARHISPKVRAFIDFAAEWFTRHAKLCSSLPKRRSRSRDND